MTLKVSFNIFLLMLEKIDILEKKVDSLIENYKNLKKENKELKEKVELAANRIERLIEILDKEGIFDEGS